MKVLPSEDESTRTQHRPTTQHERKGKGGRGRGDWGRERGKGRKRGLVGEGDLLHTVTYHERLMAGFTRDNENQKDKVPCKERMEKKGGTV